MPSNLDSIEQISDRIIAREVVFFVGSGFSIDSEGNSACRLMARLAIRFRSMVDVISQLLAEQREKLDSKHSHYERVEHLGKEVKGLTGKLEKTFSIKRNCNSNLKWMCTAKRQSTHICGISKLAVEYYAANDWFCGAFERLLEIGQWLFNKQLADFARLQKLFDQAAETYRQNRAEEQGLPLDAVPLCPIEERLFRWAYDNRKNRVREAGKALFLDTLGFAADNIMGGQPRVLRRDLHRDFDEKLFPRHYVLARLAREGFCPTVLTTNYDRLLEGAWRCVGFEWDPSTLVTEDAKSEPEFELISVPIPYMARIGSAHDFQAHGKAIDTSLVVKVHGCSEKYRRIRENVRDSPDLEHWKEYMRAIVFTYREIQNWRSDSWSRDFLANLQRTRSVAFAGYSLKDTVIHDAFRTVYEEMSANRPLTMNGQQTGYKVRRDTPAYFFGHDSSSSFHANEILSAASFAIGKRPQRPFEHDNYLRFSFRSKQKPTTGPFPNIDDLFLWMYHRAHRKYQANCLEIDLSSVLSPLLGRNSFPSERKLIQAKFKEIMDSEKDLVCSEEEQSDGWRRLMLTRTIAWTYWFHSRLLREFAIGNMIHSHNGPPAVVQTLRESEWYFPASARTFWTAWAVVVELAVRELIKMDSEEDVRTLTKNCYPVAGNVPTVLFHRQWGDGNWAAGGPEILRMQVGDFERSGLQCLDDVAVGFETSWIISSNASPWQPYTPPKPKKSDQNGDSEADDPTLRFELPFGRCFCDAPDANEIWSLALGQDTADHNWLGKPRKFEPQKVHE